LTAIVATATVFAGLTSTLNGSDSSPLAMPFWCSSAIAALT
jgi:hypothetical protein